MPRSEFGILLRSLAACLLLAASAGCSEAESPEVESPAKPPPNVILIVLDTVRADHLACYGYRRETSPNIDAFARSATRYTRSLSSAPWTIPSHASMFTGKPPFAHGAHTFAVETPKKNVNSLHLDQVTLAEALDAEGYATGAFVANAGFLARHWQLDQGFETYHAERVYSDVMNARIFDWLEKTSGPFFLFVNYIDAHRPYNTKPRVGFIDPPAVQDEGELIKELVQRVLPAKDPVPQDLARKVIDQYDTAIANLDEQVGALLARLAERGDDRNAVIVITSDHGEYFGEHSLVEHSKDVYQEAIGVPLIVRGPGQSEGRVVETPAVSNDLPGLIVGVLPEAQRRVIAPLFPDAPGNHTLLVENYYTRRKDLFHPDWGWRFQNVRRAVFEWPFKLIHSSDDRHELYDLSNDPGEQENLIEERAEVAARMFERLEQYLESTPVATGALDTTPLDEELVERLRALGYIGD